MTLVLLLRVLGRISSMALLSSAVAWVVAWWSCWVRLRHAVMLCHCDAILVFLWGRCVGPGGLVCLAAAGTDSCFLREPPGPIAKCHSRNHHNSTFLHFILCLKGTGLALPPLSHFVCPHGFSSRVCWEAMQHRSSGHKHSLPPFPFYLRRLD